MRKIHFYMLGLFLVLNSYQSTGQEVQRRAEINMTLEYANPGIRITEVTEGSPEQKAGLTANDLIVLINNHAIDTRTQYNKIRRGLRSKVKTTLNIKRGNNTLIKEIVFNPLPFESIDGVEAEYGSFTTDYGYKVRTVVYKPENSSNKKLPAIYFVQWLSCSPVETRGLNNGFSNLFWELAKKGYMVYLTEKAGTGDSNGPDCGELDFIKEYNIHKQSIKSFLNRNDINKENLYIMGGSMGSNIAAMLANDFPEFKALIFSGGYHKPWLERLLDFERRTMEFNNVNPSVIYNKMNLFNEFYGDYFQEKKTPRQILDKKPYLSEVWNGADDTQYGRPVSFYQQANSINMAEIWSNVPMPILALYGEYDWIMDKEDSETIIKNASDNANSKFVVLPKTDHSLFYYENFNSKKEAFLKRSNEPNKTVAATVVDWIKNLKI